MRIPEQWASGLDDFLPPCLSPKAASLPHTSLAPHPPKAAKGNNSCRPLPVWVFLRYSCIINYWVGVSQFPWLPSTGLHNIKVYRSGAPGALLPDTRTSLPLSPRPRQLPPSPASLCFLHPFHKVSGKKDHCFLEKGPVGKERWCRQQHLATLWLGARTRSYEIDTSNNFYFRVGTLSG